jgi:hypothetical protein
MDGRKLLAGFLGSGGAAILVASLLDMQVERAGAQTSPGTIVMFAYVGSFTTAQRKARGDGIHVYRVDSASGMWTHVQHVGDLTNPSFLALVLRWVPISAFSTRCTATRTTPPPSRSIARLAKPGC